jgi:hypothetical protein
MSANKYSWWALLLISVLRASCALGGSIVPCDQVHAAAQIARVQSLKALAEEKKKVPSGYMVEIVAAFRAFELHPQSRTLAVGLLRQVPDDEAHEEVISALEAAICDDESSAEMEVLARVEFAIPRMLARAVILAPEYMEAYVKYSLIAKEPLNKRGILQSEM